jgi:membrane protein DedA with SNARE-associated domain
VIAELIQRYGYLAVLVGTFLEGETVLVMAGYAAQRGYLDLRLVILLAFLGSFAGDQLMFWLGRRLGPRILARRPAWRPRVQSARAVLERRGAWLVLSFRFFYGFRNVTPFAIGTTEVSASWFTALNALAAAIWASVVAVAGYAFGDVLERALARAHRYEGWVLGGLAVVGTIAWLMRQARRKWRARPREPRSSD